MTQKDSRIGNGATAGLLVNRGQGEMNLIGTVRVTTDCSALARAPVLAPVAEQGPDHFLRTDSLFQ
jgi:hypothetical protein